MQENAETQSSIGKESTNSKEHVARPSAEWYQELLTNLGFKPQIDEEGDVYFEHNNLKHTVIVDENDLEYFQMFTTVPWKIVNEDEYSRAMVACMETTREHKVAKIWIGEFLPQVFATVEAHILYPLAIEPLFWKYLNSLHAAIETFLMKVSENEETSI